jgi:hypothetical protein
MKQRIIVKCSCGRKWIDDDTPERAKFWWDILDIFDPLISAHATKRKSEKTLELALRIFWARHEAFRKEKGDKRPHEVTVTVEITVETLQELKQIKGEPVQK